ncbi:MAG: hypothetical protein QOD50_1729 [Actinomycetota bacterium]|nr:hypothetical protein [Actinomycetota bacterium]
MATAGTWERSKNDARFTPRFPAVVGTEFAVIEWLNVGGGSWRELVRITVPSTGRAPRTIVESIDPRSPAVPANLLRFAVTFSTEMEEGSAAGHIQLLDETGVVMSGALLEMPPELWDREHRRLTVLLEPGRIKRGLQPHEQAGPPLREGGTVTLNVEASIRDAGGSALLEKADRTYRVGPPIRSRIDPLQWEVDWPEAPSEPLVVRFDRPLDRALARRYLQVLDAHGRAVAGRAILDDTAELWMFTSTVDNADQGSWTLRVDSRLEDVAGNSVRRVFDRDLDKPEDDGIDEPAVILTRQEISALSRGAE